MNQNKPILGLSNQEVEKRKQQGLQNIARNKQSKSYKDIVASNMFTLFHLINIILAALILSTGSYKNLLFMGVVVSNFFLGTYQELKTKRTLDKIAILLTKKAFVVREGVAQEVELEKIVMDDTLRLRSGEQVGSDCCLLQGDIEVDESMLTGESEPVTKVIGDTLYAGSFIVSGTAYAKVVKVGDDTYASKLTSNAKVLKRYPSQLRDTLNGIVKVVSLLILPLGIVMFLQSYVVLGNNYNDSVLKVCAALIGMIPEGLIVLTSIALSVGVLHLSKHKTLVQELYCLETLARVDVLCFDKTGTLTTGQMNVIKTMTLSSENIEEIMGNYLYACQDENVTSHALKAMYKESKSFSYVSQIPFSSKRKCSSVTFQQATYVLGAYQYVMDQEDDALTQSIANHTKQGYRVLVLAKQESKMQALALFVLEDQLRQDAKETLDYFYKQEVDIKLISGDDPMTVSAIAKRVGVRNSDSFVDASTLKDEELVKVCETYTIFGRVSPIQKKQLIEALRQKQHIVAMNGDGVNDVLSFKASNISIAMASGSEAAKSSANLVLLEDNFNALPHVLNEGRRVIHNIEKVASLFLSKTFFSLFLSILALLFQMPFPFVPIQLSFVSTFTIGLPAFVLALEPNFEKVKGKFIEHVLSVSLPSAISVLVSLLFLFVLQKNKVLTSDEITQMSLIALSMNGFIVLYKVARPLSRLRACLLTFVAVSLCIGLFCFPTFLTIKPIQMVALAPTILCILGLLLVASYLGKKAAMACFRINQTKKNTTINQQRRS